MKKPGEKTFLIIKGASEHNLRDISVRIPHNAITVVTGVSGSGKSSLAYDVIFRESQRRFLESFSIYSRQFIGKLVKPNVKTITGLQAALAIQQGSGVSNPRSTVGTMSGIYDYLRLLFARTGHFHCSNCGFLLQIEEAGLCPECKHPHPRLLAKLFSFNSPYGACSFCKGLGVSEQIDPGLLIADTSKTLREGALIPTTPTGYIVYSQVRVEELNRVCEAHGFSVDIPWKALSKEQQNVIWYGSDRVRILFGKHALESRLKWKGITAKPREEAYYKGMIPVMSEILHRDRNENILRFTSTSDCPECAGSRLRKEALSVSILGQNIATLSALPLSELEDFFYRLIDQDQNATVSAHLLQQALHRVENLRLLGLNYLTLSRESTSLSGGETQRIRLASQVGGKLQGILYILDEPSIGLHPRDNEKLLQVLQSLRDNGNTVLVVEHDESTIRAADFLIDMGPKAGIHGGEVIFEGNASTLLNNPKIYPKSLTANMYSNGSKAFEKRIPRPSNGSLTVFGATKNNLKNIDVTFSLNAFNVVTGVSGAGKSSLVHGVLAPALREGKMDAAAKAIESSLPIKRIVEIDQSPIGRTPRSNPATYTGLFDHIRDRFSKLPASAALGFKKGRFSFNNKGGRCETCQGAGSLQLGMHFLGDVEIGCTACGGKRFNNETLQVTDRGKNIFEVLELSIAEARLFFDGEVKITRILDQLLNLDVGYLKLGQPSTTLSGGEAQRIKLASELYKTAAGHALYILDEPTLGLHKADIRYLVDALNAIVDKGNTVIVIEHDADIIHQADHIIDLGPEGGKQGGELVFQGSLKALLACKSSHTAQSLQKADDYPARPARNATTPLKSIEFKGVSTNNLQQIDFQIPLNKLSVITGVSGSGKSSLAFDTLYSESRNRFTEGLSTYARRMMSKIKKPELEHCTGLTPAIAIRQDPFHKNPRSTVGTATELYDLYRLLYSRAGTNSQGMPANRPVSYFSFNHSSSACNHCGGLGIHITTTPGKCITNPDKPVNAGALDGSLPGKYFGDPNGQFVNTLLEVGRKKGIDLHKPFQELDETATEIILYGTGHEEYQVVWNFKRGKRSGTHSLVSTWKGFINYINEEYAIKKDGKRGEAYLDLMEELTCPACSGSRYQSEVLEILFDGRTIADLAGMSIQSSMAYFTALPARTGARELKKIRQVCDLVHSKLRILDEIGLGYITIDRPTSSLSGGEAQRLRIATQLVSDLCGLTYVLDEPTLGLHPFDTKRLMAALDTLKKNGNTLVLVEHDPEIIRKADHIIDLGPGAGSYGGKIIASGSLNDLLNNAESPTGRYLSRPLPSLKKGPGPDPKNGIHLLGATANNLKGIELRIPGECIVAITGVSGSGKTSLAFDVIAKSIKTGKPSNCKEFHAFGHSSVQVITQQKIGKSPLSTPATYTGLFDLIRNIFARTSAAGTYGFSRADFSFNNKGGRCETCKGMGRIKVSMDFLSDLWTECDSCHGSRYKNEVMKVRYKGYSIGEVLQMEIAAAIDLFNDNPKTKHILDILNDTGLGYLTLGQQTSTLSGGETQRLKLAYNLLVKASNKITYVFDEPSTGLHMQDVELLLAVFSKLVKEGHTVLVVEHNLDIIRASDWIVELGPQGGDAGGELLYSGIPANNQTLQTLSG